MAADTYGVGMLMADAARHGVAEIVVAAGGSATSDGGFGALRAIDECGGLRGTPVTVLTDVTTPYAEAAIVSAVLARSTGTARFAVVGSVGPGLGPLREELMDIMVASDEAAMEAAGRAIGQRLRLRPDTGRRVLG